MKFPLSKPIKANGEEVSVLELREPEGKDLIEIGMPMSFDAEGQTELKMKVIAKYISRLASIPPTSVYAISPQDLLEIAMEIVGFFGEPGSTSEPVPEPNSLTTT